MIQVQYIEIDMSRYTAYSAFSTMETLRTYFPPIGILRNRKRVARNG